MVRRFFLLSYFLVVAGYELSKSTSHLLSVPLTLEYVEILYLSISFFLNPLIFCARLPSQLTSICLVTACWDSVWVVILSYKSKLLENIFLFHLLLFHFEVSKFVTWSYLFKLKHLMLLLRRISPRFFFKDLKLLPKQWEFVKNVLWNQTFASLFIAISASFLYKQMI